MCYMYLYIRIIMTFYHGKSNHKIISFWVTILLSRKKIKNENTVFSRMLCYTIMGIDIKPRIKTRSTRSRETIEGLGVIYYAHHF